MKDFSILNIPFINSMVGAMYAYEAVQHLNPNLLNDAEMMDFYMTYMGGPL